MIFKTKIGEVELKESDLIIARRVLHCLEISDATLCKCEQSMRQLMVEIKQLNLFDESD